MIGLHSKIHYCRLHLVVNNVIIVIPPTFFVKGKHHGLSLLM
jgi:hypothetical protein